MHRRRGIWISGLLAALIAAAVAVQASSAARTRAAGSASPVDATYSCHVGSQRSIKIYGGVTLPPINGQKQPGVFALTTGAKSVTKNGTTTTPSQIGFGARKNSLRIDKSSCKQVNKKIPLNSKGLSGPPETATPTQFGHINMRCGAGGSVLVRLRLTIAGGVPTQALVAMRSANGKNRPLAFYKWSPRKITALSANNCSDIG
ncbi:MAG TPA: hypothetical protein VGH46_11135 [Gaiellaceae bacterium]